MYISVFMKQKEIKFRAWQDGQMLHQAGFGNYAIARFIGFIYEDAPIMQFTGVKDKNGIEVYEDDICKIQGVIDNQVICRKTDCFAPEYSSQTLSTLIEIGLTCEVVGNIHDVKE